MYSGMCLQQSRVADRFKPKCTVFLYVKGAMVQWSKQTAESTRHIVCQLHTELTFVSTGATRMEGCMQSEPGLASLLCLPLQRARQCACQGMQGGERRERGENRYSDYLK